MTTCRIEPTALVVIWLVIISMLMAEGTVAQSEGNPAGTAEPALEAEFKQLRERLTVLPEFGGDDAASKFRLAEELSRRGDMFGAAEAYRSAIELNPEWADPYRGLGQVLLDHHDYAQAVEALEAAIRLGGDDHQTLYWLGRALMGKNDLPAAESALRRAVQLRADDAEGWADLGLVRMAQGKLTEAEQALEQSIRIKPDLAEAHRLRELLVDRRQDRAAAKKAAESVLRELFARE
ncbi:MAG: tetratricopeptide repeat protein [Nitrospira sp. CR1.3]|nr:tetratricopeptide repeat protein [Nitrospira sp. CR1.3]